MKIGCFVLADWPGIEVAILVGGWPFMALGEDLVRGTARSFGVISLGGGGPGIGFCFLTSICFVLWVMVFVAKKITLCDRSLCAGLAGSYLVRYSFCNHYYLKSYDSSTRL